MTFLLMAVAATLAAPPAPAPEVPRLETLVVTRVASRVAESVDATPATVSVIERDDLERALARDIRDALRYEPGVSVENGAARFGLGNIAIRGLDGNRVQMLQDGIRIPDGYRVGSFSNASRNPFDVGLLSRIELLRGPGSALYGSDALAGVVSMTTLDPADLMGRASRFGGFARAGYGEADDSTSRSSGAAVRAGPVELMVAASRTDAHERENRGSVGGTGMARTLPNPQDGHVAATLAKAVLPLANGGRVRATYEGFERRVATDVLSLNPQSPRTVSLLGDDRAGRERASLDGEWFALGPVDQLTWLLYRQRSTTDQDTAEVRANTTAQCLSAPGNVRCLREARFHLEQVETGLGLIGKSALGTRQQLVYGAEASRTVSEELRDGRQTNLDTGAVSRVVGTDVFPTRDFPRSSLERFGAFAQDEIALGSVTLVPALRYDRFSMQPEDDPLYAAANPTRTPVSLTDSAWSPKLGALVRLGPSTTLSLQYAAGFRAPPAFDVNVGLSNLPLGYTVIPNPDLKPETSRGLEAGLRGRHGAFDYSLTAYRTDYKDLIVSRAPLACPGDARCVSTAPITFQSQNVTRARISGVEARAQWRITPRWTANAGAAWSRGEDLSKHVPLNSIDPAKAVAGLAYEAAAKAWGAESTLTAVARKTRIDQSAGTLIATPGFATLDLTGFVRLGSYTTLHAGVFNATDRKHWLWSDVRGILNAGASFDRYTQPGRALAVSVKVEFR